MNEKYWQILTVYYLKVNYTVGHSVRLAAATCSFRGQTRPSASEISPLRLVLSGTHFHMTSAHHTSVVGGSDQS